MPVIVDYEAGNVRSVQRACRHAGMEAEISSDPEVILRADRVIFPGVGSAASAVDTLSNRGLDEALKAFFASGKPLLGICLGAQIVMEHSEEGDRDCLGIVPGACERFDFTDRSIKVPHIGWNEIEIVQDHPMLSRVSTGDEFYFVHSYHVRPNSRKNVFGTTEYGGFVFNSIIGKDNLFATQFHLEKSGELGLKLLATFKDWSC